MDKPAFKDELRCADSYIGVMCPFLSPHWSSGWCARFKKGMCREVLSEELQEDEITYRKLGHILRCSECREHETGNTETEK